jgi:hypothetical protein
MFKNIHRIIAHTATTVTKAFLINTRKNIISMRDYYSFVKSIKYLMKKILLLNKKFIEVKIFLILSIKPLYIFGFI